MLVKDAVKTGNSRDLGLLTRGRRTSLGLCWKLGTKRKSHLTGGIGDSGRSSGQVLPRSAEG